MAPRKMKKKVRDLEKENQFLRLELSEAKERIVDVLSIAMKTKDGYSHLHTERVAHYSLLIAEQLEKQFNYKVDYCSLILHDIGKIGVPEGILYKTTRLSEEEYNIVKTHPQMGASIVAPIPFLNDAMNAIFHHHERWDGQGYPQGLRGRAIPLAARILAVADAFDAMTTNRPYRRAISPLQAREELVICAGTQFDPNVVATFLNVWDEVEEYYKDLKVA